jgi:O-antigen/teichoic acid export membrane protein
LTAICFALAPISPSSGKDLFDYKKPTAILIVLPVTLLIMHYLGWLGFWGYVLIGVVAAILIPIFFSKIEHEKKTLVQADVNLWFK